METTPNGLPFIARYLCCSETFTLHPIAGLHTQADVREAKQWLMDNRDVETVHERYDFSRDEINRVATEWKETDEGPTVAHWNSRQCQAKLIALITTAVERDIMIKGQIVEPIHHRWLSLDDKTNTDTPHYVALPDRLAFVWLPNLPFVDQATFDNRRDSISELYNDRELLISYDHPAEPA